MCYVCLLDCGGMERGIFGNLQKVLSQPHGLTIGDCFLLNSFMLNIQWDFNYLLKLEHALFLEY